MIPKTFREVSSRFHCTKNVNLLQPQPYFERCKSELCQTKECSQMTYNFSADIIQLDSFTYKLPTKL